MEIATSILFGFDRIRITLLAFCILSSVSYSMGQSVETDITTFSLPEQTGDATIGTGTVDLEVAYGTDLTSLSPSITASPGATIVSESGVIQDFTSPVEYTVTAEDGSTTEIVALPVIGPL